MHTAGGAAHPTKHPEIALCKLWTDDHFAYHEAERLASSAEGADHFGPLQKRCCVISVLQTSFSFASPRALWSAASLTRPKFLPGLPQAHCFSLSVLLQLPLMFLTMLFFLLEQYERPAKLFSIWMFTNFPVRMELHLSLKMCLRVSPYYAIFYLPLN